MGPTQVLRGSHRGLAAWARRWADAEARGPAQRGGALVSSLMAGAGADGASAVPAGSLLVFNSRVFHRTDPAGNRAAGPRDIITNTYALPAVGKTQLLQPAPPGPGGKSTAGRLVQTLGKL